MIQTKTIQITPGLLSLLSEIDEFKGAWRALGSLAPERLNALRRVATIESIGSSTRIEGSKLSDLDVAELLNKFDIKKFDNRDEQEIMGYAEVMETIFQAWQDISITENHIKQLHRDLLIYSVKDARHRGHYKTTRNDVGAFDSSGKLVGVVFETATPFNTPQRMTELIQWFNDARAMKSLHPLLIIALFTVVFLEIHPFQDGNGRLSRVLTTLMLLQAGYVYVPYSSLESVIEQSKESYYMALRQTQKTIRTDSPNWQPWLMFFMRSLQHQKRRLADKINREHHFLMDLSELGIRTLDYARQHGRVTNRDMVRTYGYSSNTLKATLRALVDKRLLTRHGSGRSTWYSLPIGIDTKD